MAGVYFEPQTNCAAPEGASSEKNPDCGPWPQVISGKASMKTLKVIRTEVRLEKWGNTAAARRFEPPPGTPDIDPPQAGQVLSDRFTSSRQCGHMRTGARMPRSVISQEASVASSDIFQRVLRHSHAGLLNPRRFSNPIHSSKASRVSFASRCMRGVYPISKFRSAERPARASAWPCL